MSDAGRLFQCIYKTPGSLGAEWDQWNPISAFGGVYTVYATEEEARAHALADLNTSPVCAGLPDERKQQILADMRVVEVGRGYLRKAS